MPPNYRYIKVSPIAGALGAEIKNVYIGQPMERQVVSEIRQAFLDHLVIFFRNQELAPQEQLAFAQQFGEPMAYRQMKGLPECPLITAVIKLEQVNFGGVWHSDTSYLQHPPMASILRHRDSTIRRRHAIRQPEYGLREPLGGS